MRQTTRRQPVIHFPSRPHSRQGGATLEAGAIWKNSAAEVAAESDVVFSCVGYPTDVQEVFFGEQGVLSQWTKESHVADKIYVDMSTSSPELAIKIADAAKKHGFQALDAPVSGGDVGAQNGTLSIMIGGDEEPAQRIHPILAVLGTNIRRQGPSGAGQRTKLANQILISGSMIGVCALSTRIRQDLILRTFSRRSPPARRVAGRSRTMPRASQGDYEPGFYVEHFVKDMKPRSKTLIVLNWPRPDYPLSAIFTTRFLNVEARAWEPALILTLAEPPAPRLSSTIWRRRQLKVNEAKSGPFEGGRPWSQD